MADRESRGTSKVYCASCDRVFDSRELYEIHIVSSHSHASAGGKYGSSGDGASRESCPLDIAISKLVGLFRRR